MDRFFGRASWAASQVVGVAPQMIAQLDHAALQASGMAVLDDKAEAAKKSLGGRGTIGFDIGWGLMHLPVTSQQIAEVRSGLSESDQHGFDVALAPRADSARMEWRWATDVLDPDTVQRMAAHLDRLAAAVATDPDVALSRIPLLSDD